MNKKYLPVAALIIIIIGLYGAYRVYNHFKRVQQTTGTPSTESSQSGTTMSNLKSLIAAGVAQTCTYNSDKSQGTVRMSGGNVRADINTTVGSVVTVAHMIVKDKTSYLWMDGKSTGFKMAFDPNATPPPAASPSNNTQGGLDANENMNYSCSPWVSDPSAFDLPTGVNFASFTVPSTSGGTSSQCSYCDSLTGTQKAQCLSALNCK